MSGSAADGSGCASLQAASYYMSHYATHFSGSGSSRPAWASIPQVIGPSAMH
jgi:hypothetical protein